MSVIELHNVTMSRSGHTIVNQVSWTTQAHQHWVVMGPNGAGKTSLVRALTGREYVDSGDIHLVDAPLSHYSSEELGTIVGFASSSLLPRVNSAMSAQDVVKTAAWGQSVTFDEEYEDVDESRAQDVLAAFGVAHVAHQRFSTLSEGERQRVLLARALMADPQILILDEPTAGLDLGARETLMRALKEIMQDPHAPQVVIITHHVEEIPSGITHALLVKDGAVHSSGPIAQVVTGVNMSELFDIPLNVTHHDGRWTANAL